LAVVVLLACSACSSDGDDGEESMDDRLQNLSQAGVYVGGVAYTTTLVGIHFEPRGDDPPFMRVFVSDGLPGGAAEWFEGQARRDGFSFTSVGGRAKLEGRLDPFHTHGTLTLADGVSRVFATRPAGDGAGVFEVTVGPDGAWAGRSLDGSTMEADQTDATVDGFVRSNTGNLYRFHHNDLSRRLGYSRLGGQPDRYTLVVTRRGTEIVGRGGDVRGGRPSENLIALDLPASDVPTPGVYYGRVAMSTDKMAFDINDLAGGRRQLRAYVSDGEPEPAGDIEWFTSPITGDAFSLTSVSGNARIEGTIVADGVSGTITLPDSPPRRYFAAPAGDGAGIYDVTVMPDRGHVGTSEEGGRLELAYEQGMVMGRVVAPNGEAADLLGADLTQSYEYGVEGSMPGTYVAFAAPRGRFLIGRNGDVRGGRPGVNIIGLDKKC
jgi:hypothetical protein